jgi:hypothetical protein
MNEIFRHIAPTDLRDFAKSLGWQLLPEAVADGLYVLSNPNYHLRQLVFPLNSDAPDYADAVEISLTKLSELSGSSLEAILAAVNEVKDDTLRLRIVDSRHQQSFIPLLYAASAINGAKDLFLSAACSVLKPQFHHPRLSRSEALQLVDKSKFRHTENGSFVLKVSSPVNALEYQGTLFNEDMPFARQTTLTINQALAELVTAIQADTLLQLIDNIKENPKPKISSNLCKAIVNFQEEHGDFDLFVNFNWAGILPLPGDIHVNSTIKIQQDYFSRIDEVRKELRNSEQQNKQEDIFIATVEHLAGEIGIEGKRHGDIILNLYQEDEIIKARVTLNSDQYILADEAHMNPGTYIKVKGKLHPGNQPRSITDLDIFDLLRP